MEGNKDCNAQKMTSDILKMLNDVVYADGMISPREEAAIKEIAASIFPSGTIDKAISKIKNGICEVGGIIGNKNFIKDSSSLAERAKQKLLELKFIK
ncbi:MAG TPA: hypothetical protein DCS88_14690 [Alphaproteobacteria bacterium]|nr:hypothetical protein [Alphaproteobacteria bacterium]